MRSRRHHPTDGLGRQHERRSAQTCGSAWVRCPRHRRSRDRVPTEPGPSVHTRARASRSPNARPGAPRARSPGRRRRHRKSAKTLLPHHGAGPFGVTAGPDAKTSEGAAQGGRSPGIFVRRWSGDSFGSTPPPPSRLSAKLRIPMGSLRVVVGAPWLRDVPVLPPGSCPSSCLPGQPPPPDSAPSLRLTSRWTRLLPDGKLMDSHTAR